MCFINAITTTTTTSSTAATTKMFSCHDFAANRVYIFFIPESLPLFCVKVLVQLKHHPLNFAGKSNIELTFDAT